MNRYIILSDLDGTLLNNKSRLTHKTKGYIRGLRAKGHTFVIATGRPYQGAQKYIKALKPNIAVCDNGGSIYFIKEKRNIFRTINKELFISYVKEIRGYLLGAISQDLNNICIENDSIVPDWCKHVDKTRIVRYGKIDEIINHEPINPCLFINPIYFNKCKEILAKDKYKSIGFRSWSSTYYINIELFSLNGTKGKALKFIHSELSIPLEYSIAIGDERNDIELIEASANGIAMINGKEELKEIAKYISDFDNNHNGAIKAIDKILKGRV